MSICGPDTCPYSTTHQRSFTRNNRVRIFILDLGLFCQLLMCTRYKACDIDARCPAKLVLPILRTFLELAREIWRAVHGKTDKSQLVNTILTLFHFHNHARYAILCLIPAFSALDHLYSQYTLIAGRD